MSAIAQHAVKRGWRVVGVAVATAIASALYGSGVFDRTSPFGFDDPASESVRAGETVARSTGHESTPEVVLLVRPRDSVRSAAGALEIRAAAAKLTAIEGIAGVTTPRANRDLISADGSSALVLGARRAGAGDAGEIGERVVQAFEDEARVTAGGSAVAAHELNELTASELRKIELFAAPVLLFVSLLVFRSLVAALLPLLVGLLSVSFTLGALRALTDVMTIDVFALNVITVLGLGLAIDYSLFMVTRYRREIAGRGPGEAAMRATLATAGRMIAFSAVIVAAAVAALAVFPQPFLYSSGIGCAIVALISAGVVLVILPAVLGLLGSNIDRLALPVIRRTRTEVRAGRSRRPHSAVVAIAAGALMIVASLPLQEASLSRADARSLPSQQSARVVDDAIRADFAVHPDSSIVVVLPGADRERGPIEDARATLRRHQGVTGATAPVSDGESLNWVSLSSSLVPTSREAEALVESARSIDWGGPVLVYGGAAERIDQRDSLNEHLPTAIALIVATTLLILLVMTGSLLLPLLALLANALTVGATLGLLVFIFQDGRFESLLSYDNVGALDSSVPILLFAVIFGLSTDYGVFLFTRIAEARRTGLTDDEAIVDALSSSRWIIMAAAALFAVAMGSFVFSQMIFIKEVAVGAAAAVLIDATIVRSLLLPALLRLGGRWTWWSPGPLARLANRSAGEAR